MRKSERACNRQTSTAADSVADYEALITRVSEPSEGFVKENAGIDRNLHSANDPRLSVVGGSALIRDYLVLKFTIKFSVKRTCNFQSKMIPDANANAVRMPPLGVCVWLLPWDGAKMKGSHLI